MVLPADILDTIDENSLYSLDKNVLDAIIAREFLGFKITDRSIMSGSFVGYVYDYDKIAPVPDISSSASTAFNVLTQMKKKLSMGAIFIEWWGDGQWYVCNRPKGFRKDIGAVEAHCDGIRTGKDDLPLAVARFMVLILKKGAEHE